MITTIVKWVSLFASLLRAALSGMPASGTIVTTVGLAVWLGLIVTLFQAGTMRRYGWAVVLTLLVVTCNPVRPLAMTSAILWGFNLACAATFAACLIRLRTPVPAIARP